MSFLAAQNRLNASVMNKLKNCEVRIGAFTVPGIFMSATEVARLGVGVSDSQPAVQIFSSDAPADPDDMSIEIDGKPYIVGGHASGGTGFTTLSVELA